MAKSIRDSETNHRVVGGQKTKDFAKAPFGRRLDGTPKGKGFLGLLKRPDGKTSTELSMSVDFGDGKETLIPAIVPTLDKNEINFLLQRQEGEPIPRSIMSKAADHARKRIGAGLSPFAD